MSHDYILVQDSDGAIVGSGGQGISASGCTTIHVSEAGLTGDAVPANVKDMINGTVSGGAYTAPTANAPCPKCVALDAIDASGIADPNLKAVVEFLQKYRKRIGG